MPRALRIQFESAVYHVNTVGVRRSHILPDNRSRMMFLAILDVAVTRFDWVCGSYCLLGTHYHLIVQTPQANIARGMQFVNGVYAQWFNRTYGTRGHAFESRYHSVLVESGEQLLRAARYVALNPVGAGLSTRAADWPWSSYRALVGETLPPRFLTPELVLHELDDRPAVARRQLRRIVDEDGFPDWPPDGAAKL